MTLKSLSLIQTSKSVLPISKVINNVGPLSGDILGMQSTILEVYYTPSTYTTAEAEISFRTTEFDSSSKICRIVGSALP
jgi:hypothetical protein